MDRVAVVLQADGTFGRHAWKPGISDHRLTVENHRHMVALQCRAMGNRDESIDQRRTKNPTDSSYEDALLSALVRRCNSLPANHQIGTGKMMLITSGIMSLSEIVVSAA